MWRGFQDRLEAEQRTLILKLIYDAPLPPPAGFVYFGGHASDDFVSGTLRPLVCAGVPEVQLTRPPYSLETEYRSSMLRCMCVCACHQSLLLLSAICCRRVMIYIAATVYELRRERFTVGKIRSIFL